MRPRRHARTNLIGTAFLHAGVWIPIYLLVALLIHLALGGPSPQY